MDAVTKRVLFISYDGMTDQLGQSQVIPYLKELTKAGYRFHILSVEKKQRLAEKGKMIRALLNEAGIQWTTLTFSSRPPLLSKLYDQWRLNRQTASICRREKISLLHCRSYVPAAAGLKVSKRTGIPFLFDMRGFWVDERVDSGLWKLNNPLYKFLYKTYKKKERSYFSAAAHIISLTHKGKEELVKIYHVPGDKISVIPCCADMRHFDYNKIDPAQQISLREQLGIPNDAKVLSYLGSLGGWYMTGEMLDFFSVLQRQFPGSIFLFITQDKKEDIQNKAAMYGIPDTQIRVQPAGREEVPGLLAVSDWNIFFIKDAYSKKASSPTKQAEVMAMGIPVICNDIGDTGKIVQESGAGFVVNGFSREEYEKICGQLNAGAIAPKEKIRQAAIGYFDLLHGAAVYEQVYKKLIN